MGRRCNQRVVSVEERTAKKSPASFSPSNKFERSPPRFDNKFGNDFSGITPPLSNCPLSTSWLLARACVRLDFNLGLSVCSRSNDERTANECIAERGESPFLQEKVYNACRLDWSCLDRGISKLTVCNRGMGGWCGGLQLVLKNRQNKKAAENST